MNPSFVDANVALFATGRPSPWRDPCVAILRASAGRKRHCFASAEVLQDILHPLLRRGLRDRAEMTLRLLMQSVRVAPLFAENVLAAASDSFPPELQSRDRVHVAVMQRLGLDTIISSDRGFDLVRGVRRLDPLGFEDWREEVFGQG